MANCSCYICKIDRLTFDLQEEAHENSKLQDEIERLRANANNLQGETIWLEAEIERLRASEETAWGIIANAYGGDWEQAPKASGWQAAAARWRDEYHDLVQPYNGEAAEAAGEPK